MLDFEKIEGFDWDAGNKDKNWNSHKVTNSEAEQIFFNEPLIVSVDEAHSSNTEARYAALGRTDSGKGLFIAFAVRKNLIRVISARPMSKRERIIYNENIEKNS